MPSIFPRQILIFVTLATVAFVECNEAEIPKKMSIFLRGSNTNYCQLKCGDEVHTLCNPATSHNPKKCGANYLEYNKSLNFRPIMIQGHNGIRNRIAAIMQVSNMRKLVWDKELETMAYIWLRRCDRYEVDPCTQLTRESGDPDKAYTWVTQNLISTSRRYYPESFRSGAIRTWYMAKNDISPPNLVTVTDNFVHGYFNVSNNFTQIAFGTMTRIGCAMTRSNYIYTIACNYYRYDINRPAFRRGRPATNCPNGYPIPSIRYTNLCTDRGSITLKESSFIIIILASVLLILSTLPFLLLY